MYYDDGANPYIEHRESAIVLRYTANSGSQHHSSIFLISALSFYFCIFTLDNLEIEVDSILRIFSSPRREGSVNFLDLSLSIAKLTIFLHFIN